ncbi:MAG: DNA repair protein RadC [Pseudomonadota bacterium]
MKVSRLSRRESGQDHQAGHRQRLRDRFLRGGQGALADYEILELLLFSVYPRRDVKPMAKRLLVHFGSLGAVLSASQEQLRAMKIKSDAVIVALKIVPIAATMMMHESCEGKDVVRNFSDLMNYLSLRLKNHKVEEVRLTFLDADNQVLRDEQHRLGGISDAPVYPGEIAKRALEVGASGVIIIHNHPSGKAEPSAADKRITQAIAKALATVDIGLFDHVIIAGSQYFSFRQAGLLP